MPFFRIGNFSKCFRISEFSTKYLLVSWEVAVWAQATAKKVKRMMSFIASNGFRIEQFVQDDYRSKMASSIFMEKLATLIFKLSTRYRCLMMPCGHMWWKNDKVQKLYIMLVLTSYESCKIRHYYTYAPL